MIECCRLPGCRGVAGFAVRSILAAVTVIGRVTGETGCGRAFEFHILVTRGAQNGGVLAGQLEGGVGMVEGGRFPCGRGMTGFALSAKRTAVRVGGTMTGGTSSGCADEEFILVALSAGDCRMLARQLEV